MTTLATALKRALERRTAVDSLARRLAPLYPYHYDLVLAVCRRLLGDEGLVRRSLDSGMPDSMSRALADVMGLEAAVAESRAWP